jgi:antitoxin HigA-1
MINGAFVSNGETATLLMLKLWIIISKLEIIFCVFPQKNHFVNLLIPLIEAKEHNMQKRTKLLDTIFPGEILLEEFMKPLSLSINQLARDIDVSPGRISEIINGKRAITADTALRLGKYFGVSPETWLNLQTDYDLRIARRTTWLEIESHIRHRAA